MVRYVPDRTGRFQMRPHYETKELDRECELVVTRFLRELHGEARFPITTDDLTKLIESEAEDLDHYGDLSTYGPDVEGVTLFNPGRKPRVMIAAELSNDTRRANRLRTTLSHEYGHVHFHSYLWDTEAQTGELFAKGSRDPLSCKRDAMLEAPAADWMEWQAGHVCGALLMPASHVRSVVKAFREQRSYEGSLTPSNEFGRAAIDAIVDSFEVSKDAARVRLSRLELFSTSSSPGLFD